LLRHNTGCRYPLQKRSPRHISAWRLFDRMLLDRIADVDISQPATVTGITN
jgi:hypothetical protein